MALLEVPALRPEDISHWQTYAPQDAAWSRTVKFRDKCLKSLDVIAEWSLSGPCYVATSWGKDSMVVAHMAWSLIQAGGLTLPLVWIRSSHANPYCVLVRDEYLRRWDGHEYHEEFVQRPDTPLSLDEQTGHATYGTLEMGLSRIYPIYGNRWIGGIRADESGGRSRRISRGLTLGNSCQPIGYWTAQDVFAYLYAHDLPVHPAYAMSYGGSLSRDRLRVAPIGGSPGVGHGRAQWETDYYGRGR